MSIGGGSQKQKSSSESSSNSMNYGSDVWAGQSPYLAELFARGSAQAWDNSGTNTAQGYINNGAANLGYATDALGTSDATLNRLMHPETDPALSAYATNLGQQFNEQFLPGLKGDAATAGQLGGSRQQIGSALGAQRAMQTLGDFTAQTYAGSQDRALQAATAMGQNAQGFQGNAQLNAQLAEFSRSMPWYNLSQYAGLLGSPIMKDLGGYSLSSGTGSGSGSGWNAHAGLGSS